MLPVSKVPGSDIGNIAAAIPFRQIPFLCIVDKPLHMQTDFPLSLFGNRSNTRASCSGIEPVGGSRQITESRRKPDSARNNARQLLHTLQDTQQLQTPDIPHKIMNLVNDDKTQVGKERKTGSMLVGDKAF